MDGIYDEPVRVWSPDFDDIFIGGEAAEGLQPASEVIGVNEVRQMRPELLMAFLVEALNCSFFDGTVHALHLTIGPRMVRLCKAMFDIVRLTDHIEPHLTGVCGVSVTRLLGELDAIVRQNRLDP